MEQPIEIEGKIMSVLAGTMFRVELNNKHQVLAHISGKMRKKFIRLTVGDRVKMEMSPYDLDKARIVYRLQSAGPAARAAPSSSFSSSSSSVFNLRMGLFAPAHYNFFTTERWPFVEVSANLPV